MKRLSLPLVDEPPTPSSRTAPWLAMGFRPFFLGAGLYAVVAMLTWLNVLSGGSIPSHLAGPLWHAHEMIFGFTLAVIAGFLLTAARRWTGLDTAHGRSLLALFGLWVAGRLAMLAPVPAVITAVVVVAFPFALAAVVGRVVFASRNTRNAGVVVLLLLLGIGAALVHADGLGLAPGVARPALIGTVHVVVTLIVVIAGRVIPLFVRNRTGAQTRSVPWVDRAAIVASIAVGCAATAHVATGAPEVARLLGALGLVAGALQLFRMRTWGAGTAWRVPMLAVLLGAYAWIGVGHLAVGASAWWGTGSSIALHALTIGAIGTATLGMMARVTMGHTGREIVAGRGLSLAFMAVSAAAFARLAGALLPPRLLSWSWIVAGSLFVAAFAAYVAVTWRWSIEPRVDGMPG